MRSNPDQLEQEIERPGLRPPLPGEPPARRGEGRPTMPPARLQDVAWKDILLRVYRGISDDRILANAAGVTFYALLAIFPGIAALVSIYGLFADPASIASHLDAAAGIVPGGAIDVLRAQLIRLAAQGSTTLGAGFAIGLAISLWSANSGTKALFDALNAVYEKTEERGILALNAISLCFTGATLLFLLLAIAAVIALPIALHRLPLADATGEILTVARWPILFVLIAVALSLVYRYGPCRPEPRRRGWINGGSASGAAVWIAVSLLFSWYAANFGSFNKTYGSLGAAVGFMTWIWLSAIIVLLGGKLNAVIERCTAGPRDLTRRRGC